MQKQREDKYNQNYVILQCNQCDKLYTEQIGRNFKNRHKEHMKH
jgi:hypothetical protein